MAAISSYLRPSALVPRVRHLPGLVTLGLAVAISWCTLAARAEHSAHRIISIIPATTEMLFAMGAGDRLVGVGSFDRYPPQDVARLPRVGALLDPNVERMLSLKPDLVVMYDTQVELRHQLERAGIPLFSYTHSGVSDITQTIRSLGARIGVEQPAARLADRLERQIRDIRVRIEGRPRLNTLLVFGRELGSLRNIDASGGQGFLHDMLEIAGAANVLGDIHRQSVVVTTEMVLARAPDVIIELRYTSSLTPARLESERHGWDALPSVPAVKSGRVYLLQGDEFVVPGPRVVTAIERFARLLHPEAWP